MKNTIGQNIAYFRKKAGMTQEELSEKMAVTAQAVSKWENDLSYPDLSCVAALAKILGTTADGILYGETAVAKVELAENGHVEKRMMVISVKGSKDVVCVRLPVALLLRSHASGNLGAVLGDEVAARYMESVLEIIESGTVGTVLEVHTEDTDVRIEVTEYEN